MRVCTEEGVYLSLFLKRKQETEVGHGECRGKAKGLKQLSWLICFYRLSLLVTKSRYVCYQMCLTIYCQSAHKYL